MEFPIQIDSGWRGPKTALIKNPDQHTNAYHVNLRGTSDVEVRRGGPQGPLIGRVEYRCWSKHDDVYFSSNQPVTLSRASMFSRAETLVLPASPKASQFYWRREQGLSSRCRMWLEDGDGVVVAQFASKHVKSRDGVVTLVVGGLSQEFVDQIFVSFVGLGRSSGGRGMRRFRRGRVRFGSFCVLDVVLL